MSTAQRTTQAIPVPVVAPVSIPRLQNGDRLTRVEFERRYLAMPEVKKAQLIEGIVREISVADGGRVICQ